jgi:hypothetical protein
MGAQNNIWVLLFDDFDHRAGVESVQGQAPLLKLPGTVKGFIEPTEEIWPARHKVDIEIRIDLSKYGIRVAEDFNMPCGDTLCCKGSDKRVRCPEMTRGCSRG